MYNGKALVRTGIRSDNLIGDKWVEVNPPKEELKIVQVSVGMNAVSALLHITMCYSALICEFVRTQFLLSKKVWCVTNDNHVWFRRGIKGEIAGISEEAAIGNQWIEMVGNISEVSVAPNDQVFAIGSDEDRYLYFRWGVSSNDLTGKRWVKMQCPMQCSSRTSSTLSLSSRKSSMDSPAQAHRSTNSLYKEKGRVETSAIIENVTILDGASHYSRQKYFNSPPASLNEKFDNRYKVRVMEQTASSAPTEHVSEVKGRYYEPSSARHPRAWSPVRSVGSIVGTEAHPESDSTLFETDSNRGSCIFDDEDIHGVAQYWNESEPVFTCCTAGAVLFEPNHLPNWFKDSPLSADTVVDISKEWRKKTIEKLGERLKDFDSSSYEKAIEMSSWVKSVEAKVAKYGGDSFDDCLVELEWLTLSTQSSGTITVLNMDGVTAKMQLSLSDIMCVMCCSEPGAPRIGLYAPRLPSDASPIKLQFPNQSEMEDWLSHLTSVCCELNGVLGKPADDTLFTTTRYGDVFYFDPTNHKSSQYNPETKLFEVQSDMLGAETPYHSPLVNGMAVGSILEIRGCIFDDASQVRFDLQCHSTLKARFIIEKMRHVACHLNPRFNERIIVLNSMEFSEWMNELRTSDMVFSPGKEFKLEIR